MTTIGTAKLVGENSQGPTYRRTASQLIADERQNALFFFCYGHEHPNMLSNFKKLASTQNKSSMFYL